MRELINTVIQENKKMKTTPLIALLVLTSESFGAPTEIELAEREETKALKAEIASHELVLKSLQTRLLTIQSKKEVVLSIAIKDDHYVVKNQIIPLIDSKDAPKKVLDTLFDAVKKVCKNSQINAIRIQASKSSSYGSVQDVIEAGKAAGIINISIYDTEKEG